MSKYDELDTFAYELDKYKINDDLYYENWCGSMSITQMEGIRDHFQHKINEVRADELQESMAWQFMEKADLFTYIKHQQKRLETLRPTCNATNHATNTDGTGCQCGHIIKV